MLQMVIRNMRRRLLKVSKIFHDGRLLQEVSRRTSLLAALPKEFLNLLRFWNRLLISVQSAERSQPSHHFVHRFSGHVTGPFGMFILYSKASM